METPVARKMEQHIKFTRELLKHQPLEIYFSPRTSRHIRNKKLSRRFMRILSGSVHKTHVMKRKTQLWAKEKLFLSIIDQTSEGCCKESVCCCWNAGAFFYFTFTRISRLIVANFPRKALKTSFSWEREALLALKPQKAFNKTLNNFIMGLRKAYCRTPLITFQQCEVKLESEAT